MMETIPEEEPSCNSDGKLIYLQLRTEFVDFSKRTEDNKCKCVKAIIIENVEGLPNKQNFHTLEINHSSKILVSTPAEIKKIHSLDPEISPSNTVNEEPITVQDNIHEHETVSEAFQKGRTNTDILWLFIFICFAFTWLSFGVYVGVFSKITSFLLTYSSYKEECDSSGKYYLMYFDFANHFKNTVFSSLTDIYIKSKFCPAGKACVSECPTSTWTADLYLKHIAPFNYSLIQDDLICVSDRIKKKITTPYELMDSINMNLCARKYSYNIPVLHLCLPFELIINWIKDKFKWIVAINVAEFIYSCILENALYVQIVFSLSCLTLMIYVCLLRWIASPLLKFSVTGFILYAIIGFISTVSDFFGIENKYFINFFHIWFIKEGSIIFTALSIILTAILLLVVIKKVVDLIRFKHYIKPGLILISESSKIILQTKGSLVFVFFVIHIYFVLALWAWNIVICLMDESDQDYKIQNRNTLPCNCTGEYQSAIDGDKCLPENFTHFCSNCSCSKSNLVKFYFVLIIGIFNVLAVTWATMFIYAFSKMVLAYSFCGWYHNADKKESLQYHIIYSTKTILRYHLGTAAFGSFRIFQNNLHKIMVIMSMIPKFHHLICPIQINLSAPTDKYSLIICAVNGTNLKNSKENLNTETERKQLNTATKKLLNIFKWTIFTALIVFLFLTEQNETFCSTITLYFLCFCIYLSSTVYIQVCDILAETLIYCYNQDQNSKSKIKISIPENLRRCFEKQDSTTGENRQDRGSS